ncbi:MAG: ROK family protein [Bacillota bacterium]|nr:ROK family protein [Bacillota bacterium]
MKIAAIDIGGTFIKSGVYDSDSKVLDDIASFPTNANSGEALMEQISGIIESLGLVERIGISTAGQVDPVNGQIVFATDNIKNYTGTKVKQILEKKFNLPVRVENDVNAAAYAEAKLGAGQGFSDFICLTFGTGIGGAIYTNGGLYYGSGCSAAEFGHIITHVGGRKCTCGSYGCYETYASASALYKEFGDTADLQLLIKENASIAEIVSSWVTEVTAGLAGIIHCFNPSLVVLGGRIMENSEIISLIVQRLPSQLMPSFRNVCIRGAQLGNTAGMIGAALLANGM